DVLACARETLSLGERPGGTVEAVGENSNPHTCTVDAELRPCEVTAHRAVALTRREPDSRRGQSGLDESQTVGHRHVAERGDRYEARNGVIVDLGAEHALGDELRHE